MQAKVTSDIYDIVAYTRENTERFFGKYKNYTYITVKYFRESSLPEVNAEKIKTNEANNKYLYKLL